MADRSERFDRRFVRGLAKRFGKYAEAMDVYPPKWPDFSAMLDGLEKAGGKPITAAATNASWPVLLRIEQFLNIALEEVESPIEEYILLALTLASLELADSVTLIKKGRHLAVRIHPCLDEVYIEPQAKIGEYRVDFLVKWVATHYQAFEQDGPVSSWQVEERLVVECDGHDYHEKTKEQAKRDRRQDRQLQSVGYAVFRFTGSEIWEDTVACAASALRFLSEKVHDRLYDSYGL